jgi:predicted nucleic acid-binding protein
VPTFCDLEMISALRDGAIRGVFTREQATEVFADHLALPLTRHDHRHLLVRIFALRENFTPYDAAYVALAEALSATLVTCDQRLTRAARQLTDLNVLGVA